MEDLLFLIKLVVTANTLASHDALMHRASPKSSLEVNTNSSSLESALCFKVVQKLSFVSTVYLSEVWRKERVHTAARAAHWAVSLPSSQGVLRELFGLNASPAARTMRSA